MKKIWQKSLASMVSAALCLTAFVGCLTVNAATTYNGKITSDGVAVETTATEATVKLTISAEVPMAAAGITVSTDFGALTNVSVPTENEVLYKIDPPADGGFNLANGTVIVEAKDQKDYPFNNAEVTLTFTKNKELTLNENDSFAVNVTPLKNSTIPAATYNEDEIYFTVDVINITVKASTPVCEHTWKVVEATPATASSTGSLTRTCSECGQSETVEVSYYNNYLSNSQNASYASAITLEFNSRDDRLTAQGAYSDAFIRFTHNINGEAEPKVTYQSVSDSYPTTVNGRACTTWAYAVKSTQLTEIITSNVFVEVGGVWYNGDVRSTSVRSYADNIIAGVAESEQKLIVNMLRYGSKMQQFKGYNTANLADANLGEYEALITTTDPTIVDSGNYGDDTMTDCIYMLQSFTLDMASRTEAILNVRSDKYSGANKDNFTIVASWTNANGVVLTRTYKNAKYASAGDLVYQNQLDSSGNERENRYSFSFAELNSFDLRQLVTFSIYDGENEVSRGYVTSIESLVAVGNANGVYGEAEIAVYKAMLNYCDASRAHFCQ